MVAKAMSKKFPKARNKSVKSESVKSALKISKIDENSALEIVVGLENVKRWNNLKDAFSYKTNEIFASKLLDLAQGFLKR